MDKHIFELIDTIQKGNKEKITDIPTIFQDQIKCYGRKAQSEDIQQDLYIFLLHLINTISLDKMNNTNDKTLISYISHSIKFKFYKYFKQQYNQSNTELNFLDEINYEENPANYISENRVFSDLEFLNLLKDLTDKERNVISNKYKYGLAVSEIAKKNKGSVQAVYKLEKRALNKLRKLLP